MQRRAFLILHGIENHRPPTHWQFWLAAALAEAGHVVRYPGLPDPDAPSYDVWRVALETELTQLAAEAGDDERVVICHSLGCLLWLRAATQLPAELRPDRVLLVSPPDSDEVPEGGASFRLDPTALDGAQVRASAGEVRVVCSDSDPFNPSGVLAMYAAPLGLPADVVPGAGHISAGDGYGAWPSVLAWCTDPAAAITGRSIPVATS